jgi:ribosomal protein L29
MTPEQREARRQQMREMTPEQREARRQQMREMTPEQREARRAEMRQRRLAGERGPVARGQLQVPEELRPVFQQLRDNNRSALAEARAVLTAEQQTRLLDLAQQRHGGAGERRWQGRGMRGSR